MFIGRSGDELCPVTGTLHDVATARGLSFCQKEGDHSPKRTLLPGFRQLCGQKGSSLATTLDIAFG